MKVVSQKSMKTRCVKVPLFNLRHFGSYVTSCAEADAHR